MDLTMNTSKLFLNFDNLFNGDKFLCEQTNALLNRRSDDVFRELRKRIESSFSAEISERVNEAFSKFQYTDYFLPGPIPEMKVLPEVRKASPAKTVDIGKENKLNMPLEAEKTTVDDNKEKTNIN